MSIFIYIFVLILVVIISIYLDKYREEHFNDLDVRNIPVDKSIQMRKKILFPDDKTPFLEENDFLIWNDSLEFRHDITTSKNTYEPRYLENLLKRFTNSLKYNDIEFIELKKGEKIDIEKFLEIVDNITNMLINAIYYDIFKNPKRPQNIMCPNINMCRVELIKKKIVRVRKNPKGILKWDILLELTVFNKAYSYGILCIVEDNTLVDLRIIGIRTADQYELKPDYDRDPQIMITQESTAPYGGYKNYYRYNENDEVLIKGNTNKMVSDYLSKQFYKPSGTINFKKELPEDYSCYGSHGKDQTECENNYDTYYKNKSRGVWDKYCKVDTDCPFYKANKNYTNTFGGCIEGKCEMPIGIERVSPRYYDIDSVPKCYNCSNNKTDCCKDQKNPDYMFQDDILVRRAHESELRDKGLGIT